MECTVSEKLWLNLNFKVRPVLGCIVGKLYASTDMEGCNITSGTFKKRLNVQTLLSSLQKSLFGNKPPEEYGSLKGEELD